ncbi:MAG: hypothetical protein BGO51_28370 [Rhodospirillales bacterium 69-11]|nr:hypothetical protein [Rhodospirillales bacterium]OJW25222.1 MAG: hypothetical protein BGO51_28370 [Rhodospirillales bacterium 69-11]
MPAIPSSQSTLDAAATSAAAAVDTALANLASAISAYWTAAQAQAVNATVIGNSTLFGRLKATSSLQIPAIVAAKNDVLSKAFGLIRGPSNGATVASSHPVATTSDIYSP